MDHRHHTFVCLFVLKTHNGNYIVHFNMLQEMQQKMQQKFEIEKSDMQQVFDNDLGIYNTTWPIAWQRLCATETLRLGTEAMTLNIRYFTHYKCTKRLRTIPPYIIRILSTFFVYNRAFTSSINSGNTTEYSTHFSLKSEGYYTTLQGHCLLHNYTYVN